MDLLQHLRGDAVAFRKQRHLISKLLFLAIILCPYFLFAAGDINSTIQGWNSKARVIAKSIVALAAIGGGVIVFFKMQNDDGNNGKRALMSFVGALIFAAVMFVVIDEITR